MVFSARKNYAFGMTDTEMWLAVGRVLERRRLEKGYAFTKRLAKADPKAPHENTMNTIEAGRPGNTASLSEYCAVLGLRLTEVIASVLPNAKASAEAMELARVYDDLKSVQRYTRPTQADRKLVDRMSKAR